MAAAPATAAKKGGGPKKFRWSPFDQRAAKDAREGVIRNLGKEDVTVSTKSASPYFNLVTGVPGKNILRLNAKNFSNAREGKGKGKTPRNIIFVLNERLVGTREEIVVAINQIAQVFAAGRQQLPAGFNVDTILAAGNVVDEASAAGAMKGVVAQEIAAVKGRKADSKVAIAAEMAQLIEIYNLSVLRAAQKGQPKEKKEGGKKSGGKGVTPLINKYNALTPGMALDVSRMTASGAQVSTKFAIPGPGSTSQKRNVPNGPYPRLYSNSLANYVAALRMLGLSDADVQAQSAQLGLGAATAAAPAQSVAVPQLGGYAAPLATQMIQVARAATPPRVASGSLQQPVLPPMVQPARAATPPRAGSPLIAPMAGSPTRAATLPPMMGGAGSPRSAPATASGSLPLFQAAPATSVSGSVRL